jgi:hypothetical protein
MDPALHACGPLPPATLHPGLTYFHPLFGHANAAALGLTQAYDVGLHLGSAGPAGAWWGAASAPPQTPGAGAAGAGPALPPLAARVQRFRTPLCGLELPVHASALGCGSSAQGAAALLGSAARAGGSAAAALRSRPSAGASCSSSASTAAAVSSAAAHREGAPALVARAAACAALGAPMVHGAWRLLPGRAQPVQGVGGAQEGEGAQSEEPWLAHRAQAGALGVRGAGGAVAGRHACAIFTPRTGGVEQYLAPARTGTLGGGRLGC